MRQFITGSELVPSPAAAINVNLGFEPSYVRVWNPKTGVQMIWNKEVPLTTKKISPAGDGLVKACGILASTSNAAKIRNGAGVIQVNGVIKQIALANTTKSDKDFPAGKWGVFGIQAGADGTVDAGPVGSTAGYTTEALAVAAIKAASVSSDHVLLGYITVLASTSAPFEGTDEFTGTDAQEYNCYDNATMEQVESNGISLIEVGDSSTIYAGFTIGLDTDLVIAGDTLYYEVAR